LPGETRYSPPQAPVADSGPGKLSPPKPRSVIIALVLLWLNVASSAKPFIHFWDLLSRPMDVEGIFFVALITLSFLITLVLTLMIQRRQHWARFAGVFFFLFTVSFGAYALVVTWWATGMLEVVISLLGILAPSIAMILLFCQPANAWFRLDEEAR
jgi:hypothetical protein